MSEVLHLVGVIFSYAVLAIFAQNAIFTRGLGGSRLVLLVGDKRTSSWWFALMLCITQHPGVLERPAHWEGGAKQSFDQGMYKADLLLFVKQKDYGPMPKSGKQITLDKKRIYNIKSCSLKAGMYRMELERVR